MAPKIDHVEITDRTVGKPDGPPEFRPEFGCKVGTFTMRRRDLDHALYVNVPCLMFHVPLQFRGHYRPERLPTYSGEPDDYKVDNSGYRLCEAETKRRPTGCLRRASNRQPYCETHGARLHPLDKVRVEAKDPATMTRMELLVAGYIDVEDLTDEELLTGCAKNGRPNAMIHLPKEVYTKIINRHFDRAKELMLEGLIPAIKALKDIAANEHDIYDAQDRIKAATYIYDRVMGKQADTAIIVGGAGEGAQEPWMQIVSGIMQNTREESRANRAIEAKSAVAQQPNWQMSTDELVGAAVAATLGEQVVDEVIDAEVVEAEPIPNVSDPVPGDVPDDEASVQRSPDSAPTVKRTRVKRPKTAPTQPDVENLDEPAPKPRKRVKRPNR
ncbi:hypothetical protein GJ25_gp003 [Mycobacterium phage Hawkeye]|uniref:Uncharacterized protein n=1 Tax=Mycobacterium phage Hawkeye TaxID=1458711 RepID=X2KYR8_9CAUD|nr:hypothetical protein GJ25_gp003 [Mycobacterium phage Hawkeye]AHN84014.1 hypothetical protein PBI_HAWKEYE_3 [Mycobacterium phage Hawkeye]